MIDQLERALRIARELPEDKQAAAARYIVALSSEADAGEADAGELNDPGSGGFPPATADEIASMAESIAQADRGEFATDEEVEAMWRRHGL